MIKKLSGFFVPKLVFCVPIHSRRCTTLDFFYIKHFVDDTIVREEPFDFLRISQNKVQCGKCTVGKVSLEKKHSSYENFTYSRGNYYCVEGLLGIIFS